MRVYNYKISFALFKKRQAISNSVTENVTLVEKQSATACVDNENVQKNGGAINTDYHWVPVHLKFWCSHDNKSDSNIDKKDM